MQWLVDVLMKKQMDVPWRHAHLPSVFVDGCRPLLGKLISFSGFDESERAAMKFMVEAMGARFTPYLSRHNNILIAKTAGVEKVEKAREWDIQVVNYQWLADNYAGQRVDADNQRYQLGQPCEGVSPGPYALEMINDQFKQLLLAWKMPLIVSPEQWRLACNQHHRRANCSRKHRSTKSWGARIRRTWLRLVGSTMKINMFLLRNCDIWVDELCEEVSECYTPGDNEWSAHGAAIGGDLFGEEHRESLLDSAWINDAEQWMIRSITFLHDEDQERHLGYNCKRSVVRARHKKVFEDVQFYITPSVEPSRAVLTKLIRLAGGTVHENRPAPAHIGL
ncbi:BRCA1 protein, partial [Ostertagia ostertagi]